MNEASLSDVDHARGDLTRKRKLLDRRKFNAFGKDDVH